MADYNNILDYHRLGRVYPREGQRESFPLRLRRKTVPAIGVVIPPTSLTAGKRTIPPLLASHLAEDAQTLGLLVKLVRRDLTTFGFTTADSNIIYGGLTYEALSAVEATGIRSQTGSGVDNLDVFGLLQSDHISDADLSAGVYDGAVITIYLCNFNAISQGVIALFYGYIGEITIEDGKYTAEIRSLSQRLAQSPVEVTSKTCRVARLGDSRCAPAGLFQNGATLSTYQFSRTLATVSADGFTVTFAADVHATDYYTYGIVRYTSGNNSGLEREVKKHTLVTGQAQIVLQEPFPFASIAGDIAILEAGCDRLFSTCRTKFANWNRFRAEPYIPSNDVLKQRGRGSGS